VLLSDPEAEVCKKFGVWGKKQFMGKEYMGVQRSTFLVDEKGKIFKVFPSVKPKGHADEVLQILTN
jgi:peroxiredoxin Q/BCP